MGYGVLVVRNLRAPVGPASGGRPRPGAESYGQAPERAPLLWILAIGVLVQLSWEPVLAISGIRTFTWNTLIVNSLVEANMGLPWLYLIHRAMSRRWDEGMRRVRAAGRTDEGGTTE